VLAAAIDYETALPRGLIREEHAAIAERLDDALLDSGLQEAEALADETVSSALADGDAAIGWPEVAESVVRHLDGHLIVAPRPPWTLPSSTRTRKPHWAGRLRRCSLSVLSGKP
jgi:hypothetical protein